jgi:hypothetical protein
MVTARSTDTNNGYYYVDYSQKCRICVKLTIWVEPFGVTINQFFMGIPIHVAILFFLLNVAVAYFIIINF